MDLAGTFHFMAPEVLRAELQTAAVDVWSAGVALLHLCLGRPLLRAELGPGATGLSATDHKAATLERRGRLLLEIEQRLPLPENFPPHLSAPCWDCLRQMVMPDSQRRASLEDCFRHPWLHAEPLQLAKPADPLEAALLPGSDARLDTECQPVPPPLRALTVPRLCVPSSPAAPRALTARAPATHHAIGSSLTVHAPKGPTTARLMTSPDRVSLTGPARRPQLRGVLLSPAPPATPTLGTRSALRSPMTTTRDLRWNFQTQLQAVTAGRKCAATLPLVCISPLMTSRELTWPQVPRQHLVPAVF